MSRDKLDALIKRILENPNDLSAEATNALHGATSTHPLCSEKSFDERKASVLMAVAGRRVDLVLRGRIERLKAI